jgi:hypothetical protein
MKRLFVVLGLVAFATSCGGGTSGELSPQARATLAPLVQQARTSLEGSDPTTARHALDELRQTVAALQHDHAINAENAAQILQAATDVKRLLPIAPTTTTTTTLPARTPPGKDKNKGNSND